MGRRGFHPQKLGDLTDKNGNFTRKNRKVTNTKCDRTSKKGTWNNTHGKYFIYFMVYQYLIIKKHVEVYIVGYNPAVPRARQVWLNLDRNGWIMGVSEDGGKKTLEIVNLWLTMKG
jgi:hypothetical protein